MQNRRVTTRLLPPLGHYSALVCIDTGADSNLISERFVLFFGMLIKSTSQGASQADGKTPLQTIEVHRGTHIFHLEILVVRSLRSEIIVGEPILETNNIGVCSTKTFLRVGENP